MQALIRTGKPAFRLPGMREVRSAPPCGLSAASLFVGCGGSGLGYRLAGYRVLWANEFLPAAAACHELNHPETRLDRRDVRELSAGDVLDGCGLAEGELDLLDGSPPCQSFSINGKRQSGWGKAGKHADGTRPRSDDLFFEYLRILEGVKPRAFVAENVPGLAFGVAVGVLRRVIQRAERAGYAVGARILDAQWLGVPQRRKRLFIVGVRRDLGCPPAFPVPLSYRYSLSDALPHLRAAQFDLHGKFKVIRIGGDQPVGTIGAGAPYHWKVTDIYQSLAAKWRETVPGKNHHKAFNLARPDPEMPCPTMAAIWGKGRSLHQVLHPHEPRRFTIAELKAICSFPRDFKLRGSFSEQWARLGNSVPPLMARAVGAALRDGPLADFRRRGAA